MLKVNKQEIDIDCSLKKRIKIICSFCNATPNIYNSSIITLDNTNLAYLSFIDLLSKKRLLLSSNLINKLQFVNL